MPTRFLVFLVVFTAILALAAFYIGRRLSGRFNRYSPPWWGIWGGLLAFLALQWVAPVLYRAQPAGAVGWGVSLLQWLAYLGLGGFAMLFFLLLAADLGLTSYHLTRRVRKAEPLSPERRVFLSNAIAWSAVGSTGALASVGAYQARRTPTLNPITVPVPGLKESLNGFRIIQISDLHVGQTIRRDFVESVVEVANAAEPDLIALTGDFVDGTVRQLQNDTEPLSRLKAKHGVFYVTGNHEYYWGADSWMNCFETMGIHVLRNSHRLVEHGEGRVLVAGLLDRSDRADARAAMHGAPEVDFKLVLAHQPSCVFDIENTGADLQLSGHTHSGQFFPIAFFARFAHPYVKGLNTHARGVNPRMQVYVNQGTGYWGPPNRFGVPSEITLLTLGRADA